MRKIKLIPATLADIRLVYQWQCEPATRRFAHNTNIPTIEHHEKWMKKKLRDSSCYFYIILDAEIGQKAGVVRLDRIAESRRGDYLLSIHVSSRFQGRGLAKAALQQIDELHPNCAICAEVLPENLASRGLFIASGYKGFGDNLFVKGKKEMP